MYFMGTLKKHTGHLAWMITLIHSALSLSCHMAVLPLNDHHCRQSICPLTVHDQFRSLVAMFRPICPTPAAVTDDFLSFEEWKSLRFSQTPNETTEEAAVSFSEGRASDSSVESHSASSTPPVMPREETMPTVRVPLADRFNYASVDC